MTDFIIFLKRNKDKALYTSEFHFAFGYNFVCKTFQSGFLIGTYGGGLYLLHRNTGELSFFNQINVLCKGHLMDMKGMETINYGSAVPKVCMYMII